MSTQSMHQPSSFTPEGLDQKWEEIAEWQEDNLLAEIDQMGDHTPLLLTFLTDSGAESLSEDGQELLLFLGIFVIEAFKEVVEGPFPDLELQNLEATQIANEELFALNLESPEEFERSVSLLLEFHEQAVLLSFLGEVLMEEEETEISEEMLWEIWIYLKIMIEAID